MKKAMSCGISASFFFAFTFLLNRSMNLLGGYWVWSASLRYLFMLPMLVFLLLILKGNRFAPVFTAILKQPYSWLLWSTIGFGFFYLPLTMASVYGESWLIAATWQITIVAGVLLTPLFGQRIPFKNLGMSFIILVGVLLLQLPNMSGQSLHNNCLAFLPILIAAFSYPLGNRKIMQLCPRELDTIQRVFGMTLCSMPFWLVASLVAMVQAGLPGPGQVVQSVAVALFSGVVATLLFFHATDLVKGNQRKLAAIEATQCGEVVFTLLGGLLVIGENIPDIWGVLGLFLVIAGMLVNSLLTG